MHASLISSYALKMIGLKKGMSRREGTCYHKSINRVRESVGYQSWPDSTGLGLTRLQGTAFYIL